MCVWLPIVQCFHVQAHKENTSETEDYGNINVHVIISICLVYILSVKYSAPQNLWWRKKKFNYQENSCLLVLYDINGTSSSFPPSLCLITFCRLSTLFLAFSLMSSPQRGRNERSPLFHSLSSNHRHSLNHFKWLRDSMYRFTCREIKERHERQNVSHHI